MLWLRSDSLRPSRPASVVPLSTTVDHTGLSDKPAGSKAETSVGTGEGKCMWAAAKHPHFHW